MAVAICSYALEGSAAAAVEAEEAEHAEFGGQLAELADRALSLDAEHGQMMEEEGDGGYSPDVAWNWTREFDAEDDASRSS